MISNNPTTMVENTLSEMKVAREAFSMQIKTKEIGIVTKISMGIALVSGLPGVGLEELVIFPEGVFGIVFYLDEKEVGVVLLGEFQNLNVGDKVTRSGRVLDVGVSEALLGRVVDPLGSPLDGKNSVQVDERWPIERPAPHIMDRAPVAEPLQTGIKVIDALIPIGRGQRELIIGDRQTGKTAIAVDAILNQQNTGVLCIYCAIGQRASSIAKTIAILKENNAMRYTVVVVAEGNDPPGLSYIAPYAATSIGEYFMHKGHDVLIVYDDLSHHARSYREISLLLRRPPGREAFPGDIFYIHSRLLERSTRLGPELGGGSLTALPIIETEDQNIAAYIPTNLISITDGQIYLSPSNFELGILPAVDVGNSVSRVGGKVQLPNYQAIAGDLKLSYAQFEELETFLRFGTRMDESTRKIIEHGKRIRACLMQSEFVTVSVPEQIIILFVLVSGLFDQVPIEKMPAAEAAIKDTTKRLSPEILATLNSTTLFSTEEKEAILSQARNALSIYKG